MKDRPIVSRDVDVVGGAVAFRGTRVPVQTLLNTLEARESIDDFLKGLPSVTRGHVIPFLEEAKDPGCMTKDQMKGVIERVLTWPQERQEDAARMLLALEAREGELYHPDDDEWAAIEEGFAQARRGEAVSADEIAALFKQRAS